MFRKAEERPPGALSGIQHAWSSLWRTLIAGMLVWVPLMISVWVTWFFVNKFVLGIERLIKNTVGLLNEWGAAHPAFGFLAHVNYVYGLGVFLAVALFLGTGLLTRHFVGRRIIALGEKVVHVIPFVNRIYRAVQQIRDTFLNRQGGIFQRVCIIEYPRAEMYAIAFITAESGGIVGDTIHKDLVAVFVPTTPNPTSGYLVYLAPSEVKYLDITVEEAMKLIVSGGAYVPVGYPTKPAAPVSEKPREA